MTTQTFRLDRPRNPVVQLVPTAQPTPPRRTLVGELRLKFLDWVRQTPLRTQLRTLAGVVFLAGVVLAFLFPAFVAGMLLDVLQWNGYKVPAMLLTVALCVKGKGIIRWANRVRMKRLGANQHTYHGLPVDELASYLVERRNFTREDACAKFGVSWKKHQRIADELEHHQVLVRGENNARVLNAITREQLVRQLREDFPLAFADGEWVERRGNYHQFLRDKERADQKERERVERLEKRAGRATAILREVQELKRAEGFTYSPLVAA